MLRAFRELEVDGNDIDELIVLERFGKGLATGYTEHALDVPEWVSDKLTALGKEIKARRADAIAREIKLTEGRLEALKTADEKRVDLRAKLERLRAAQ